MKGFSKRFLASSLLAVLLAALLAPPALAAPRWEFLGERTVTDRLDRDEVLVTAARGDFRKIKLTVRRRAVDFHKVEVVFGNGTRHEVEIRQTIPAGGETRVIDLPGDERVIRKVIFWYDARSLGGRAAVRLYARN